MVDFYAKTFLRGEALPEGLTFDDFKVGETFPTAMPIRTVIGTADVFKTLSTCLLINKTLIPFVATDNPVIKYNSLARNIKGQGTIGLDQPGLQLFYPLDKHHAIYFFDPRSYKCPSNTGQRKISSRDASKLLLLYYLWAGENLYLGDGNLKLDLAPVSTELAPFVDWKRFEILETELVERDEGYGSLVVQCHPHAPIEIELDFAKITAKFDSDLYSRSEPRRKPLTDASVETISYEVKNFVPRDHFSGAPLSRLVTFMTKGGNLRNIAA